MNVTKKLKMAGAMAEMGGDLLCGRYPSFVYGRPPRRGELSPVLCLHTAEPGPFEAMLRFLADNGITTLTCDDYLHRLEHGPQPGDEKSVLLTFDDGHLSVWTTAYPLLKQYGMKATTYLIPGLVPEGGALRPQTSATHPAPADPGGASGYTLCTWAENRAMHESGVIDFQSHTHRHRLIAVSPRVVGFVSPALLRGSHPFEVMMLSAPDGEEAQPPTGAAALGSPLYASASRMAEGLRYFPDEAEAEACAAHVAGQGGEAFFEQPNRLRQRDPELYGMLRDYFNQDPAALFSGPP